LVVDREDWWDIYQNFQNLWRWRRIDAMGRLVASSSKGFPTRDECVEDARLHGYEGF
jgi:hypothetical protein